MAFFDSTAILEGAGAYANVNLDDLLEDTSVPELDSRSSLVEDAYLLIAESEENWNSIMKACGYNELKNFSETGQPYVFTEASGTGFIASAKAFFAKIWEKIQSLFKKFLVMLSSFTKSDKDFVNSNKSTILEGIQNIPSDAKFKGYHYTGIGSWADMVTSAKGTDDILANIKAEHPTTSTSDNKDSDPDATRAKMRGTVAGKTGEEMTEAEMRKALYEKFRGDEDKAEIDFTAKLVHDAMANLLNSSTIKKNADDAYKALKSYFTKVDKTLSDASKAITSGYKPKDGEADAVGSSNALVKVNRAIAEQKDLAAAYQTGNSIFLTCLKDYSRQQKAICVKTVTFRKPKHEGATFSHYGEGASFLDSVVLK